MPRAGTRASGPSPFAESPTAPEPMSLTAAGMPDCVAEVQEAMEVVVDMYFMLDRSGSMLERTASGQSKWDAVAAAFATFLADERSAGLHVSLQYYPLPDGDVPEVCAKDSDCGEAARCLSRACRPRDGDSRLQFCSQDADCPSGACVVLGQCSLAPIFKCFELGETACGARGACEPVAPECSNFESCDAAIYTTPAVEVSDLPTQAPQVISSLRRTRLLGSTPTAPALLGAVDFARARAQAEPEHEVLVVLITDGSPTACSPMAAEGIADIAAGALSGHPSIATYVIGVFADGDSFGIANSQRWALAGGTEQAFIIRPDEDVATKFLDALEEIRLGSVGCEYTLPAAPPDQTLDFARVNVAFTEPTGELMELLYVGASSGCSETARGWHYDVDPVAATPSRLQLCPHVCKELSALRGGRLAIYLGCQTEGPQ